MTKEITKAFILQEIQDKFKLREFEPDKFLFQETVIPVYNIEPHLKFQRANYIEKGITSTGGREIFVVPDTQRWSLWRYDVVFMGAGAYTVSGVYTRRRDDAASLFCYLDLGVAKSASYHINLPVPLILDAGDSIWVNIDGYTSPQDLRIYIDYTMEELR